MGDKIKEYWIYFQHGNHIILTEPPINKPHYVHVIEYRAWQAALQGMNDMARIDVFAENQELRSAIKTAVAFMESCGFNTYDETDAPDPEYQMWRRLRDVLDRRGIK